MLLVLFAPIDGGAQEGRGYIPDRIKGKCWYSQTMRENTYFMKEGNSNTYTIEFDSFDCLKATRDKKLFINYKIFRYYGQPWVEFDYTQFERSDRAVLQARGFCISATNADFIVVMIDYGIRDGYFTYVEHASGISPCGK